MDRYEALYYESIAFIQKNPLVTTDKIPDHLLEMWLCNEDITQHVSHKQRLAIVICEYGVESVGKGLFSRTLKRG